MQLSMKEFFESTLPEKDFETAKVILAIQLYKQSLMRRSLQGCRLKGIFENPESSQ